MPPPRDLPNPIAGPGDFTTTEHVHNDTYEAISPLTHATHAGKAVFVVGASRGIGLAMAISFARAGASQIALGARSRLSQQREEVLKAAREAGRPEPQVLNVEVDITSQASTEGAAKIIEAEFGKLDILINNAGILGDFKPIVKSDPDEWWKVWDVNVKGIYMITRAMLPLMLKGGDKTIITTASVGAHIVSPGLSNYQPSKLAVVRFMEFVSEEHKEDGVTAFSIHPGNVPTDIIGSFDDLPKALKPVFTESPEISADTITYLTREKRHWLTGRYVNVTWDMPELMAQKDEIIKDDKLKVKLVL